MTERPYPTRARRAGTRAFAAALAAACAVAVSPSAQAQERHHGARKPGPSPLVRIPVPLPRPANAPARAAKTPARTPTARAPEEPPSPPSACQLALAGGIAVFQPLPPITGPGECRVDDPIRLDAVILKDKSRVAFNPPATVRCTLAQAVAAWLREDTPSLAARLPSPLSSVVVADSFDCRGRNRVVGAKISEHGLGNAIDIAAFQLRDGRRIGLTDIAVDKALREGVRRSVCMRFTTVLGPRSDGYHEHHIHLDLRERHHGYRICQWAVLDASDIAAPLPRARPSPADAKVERSKTERTKTERLKTERTK